MATPALRHDFVDDHPPLPDELPAAEYNLNATRTDLALDTAEAAAADAATKVDAVAGKGLSTEDYTAAEKTKLGGVAPNATANATDAQLRDAETHTDGATKKVMTAAERTKLTGIASGATANATDAQLRDRTTHTGTQSADTVVDGATNKAYTAAEKTKLGGIASGSTANATDAQLRDRATHTGTQTSASISDFAEAAQDALAAALGGGDNVLVAYDDAANTITISAPGGGTGGLTVEDVRDAIGVAMVGVGNITVAYNDALDTITVSTTATVNDTDAALRDRSTHTGTQSADTIVDGTTNHVFTAADDTKLGGIATGATANATDAQLRDRATHTGTQSADSLTDGTTNKAFLATERTKLTGVATGATANATDAALRDRATHTGTQSADTVVDGVTNKAYTAAEKTKLGGVATGATANATDAQLRDRATHTGSQTAATISDLTESVQDIVGALLSGTTGVTVTYNDAANTLTVSGLGDASATAETIRDTIGVALVGTGLISVTANDALDTITITTTATANSTDAQLRDRATHTGTQSADTVVDGTTNKAYTAAEKTKLGGIATGATANATDAALRDRSTHTGTQPASTISDFAEAVDDRVAALIADGTGIDVVYDDAGNVLTINATGGGGSAATPYGPVALGAMAADSVNTITHNLNTTNVDPIIRRSALVTGLTASTQGEIIRDIVVRVIDPNTVTVEPSVATADGEFLLTVNPFAAPTDVTGPTAPVLSSPAHGITTVDLTLTGGTDAGIGLGGAEIYRGASGGARSKIATLNRGVDTYQDTNRAASTTYDYSVKRFDLLGKLGTESNVVSVTTNANTSPPVFDAVSMTPLASAVANTLTQTFNHPVGAGAGNAGILAVVCSNEFAANGDVAGTPTASVGGVALTYLGKVLMGNTVSAGFIAVFAGQNLPAGTQSATYTITNAGKTFGKSYAVLATYTGVGSIGPLQTVFQSATTAQTLSVPSNLTNTVWGLVANREIKTYSGASFTVRNTQASTPPYFISGDRVSLATSTPISATASGGTESAVVGLELRNT